MLHVLVHLMVAFAFSEGVPHKPCELVNTREQNDLFSRALNFKKGISAWI